MLHVTRSISVISFRIQAIRKLRISKLRFASSCQHRWMQQWWLLPVLCYTCSVVEGDSQLLKHWGSSHLMFLPHSFRWKAALRNSFFSGLQFRPKEASKSEREVPRKAWSHSPLLVPPIPRTMWPLWRRRLLWKHQDIMNKEQKLHSFVNISLTLITGVVKIHLVWTLPVSSKTLLLASHPHLNPRQSFSTNC